MGNASHDPGDHPHNTGYRQWFYVAGFVALVAAIAAIAHLLGK